MKYLLENKRIALIIMIFSILGSSVYGVKRSLSKLYNEVEILFYEGYDRDGYGINSDLISMSSEAYSFVLISKNYENIDKDKIEALNTAVSLLNEANSIEEKYEGYALLKPTALELMSELEASSLSMSSSDLSIFDRAKSNFEAKLDTIAKDPYNEEVVFYNHEINRFPSNILRNLVGIKKAKVFK